ncbi:hypothetical protein BG004_006436 [Podila humilis]|nr:hypothetical protein BG004_006436 [Podila humilis]
MLNELSRIEMFVTRIETVGKQAEVVAELSRTIAHLEQTLYNYELENGNAVRVDDAPGRVMLQRYMIRTGLAEMFPKSSEYLGIDPVIPGASFLEAHFRQMSYTNQLVSIALQLQNDIRLTNHKYMAHQTALLYVREQQCINQAGPFLAKYKARVEEQFDALKEVSNLSDEPVLTPELQAWLSDITTDIVADALFSGRTMAQQTPNGAHLSDYINRVSSGNSWENNDNSIQAT